MNDLKVTLPPGVNEPQVIDDFGDVYGILLAVTGDGYSYKELLDYVDYLRRELELVDGVSKVSVSGQQQEQVFIEVSMKKLSSIGLSPNTVLTCCLRKILCLMLALFVLVMSTFEFSLRVSSKALMS